MDVCNIDAMDVIVVAIEDSSMMGAHGDASRDHGAFWLEGAIYDAKNLDFNETSWTKG